MHYYTDVMKKYAVFEGRASRKEFWMFVLFNFLIALAVGIIEGILDINSLSDLYSLAVLVPSFAVTSRRLHDIGKSAWWLLLVLIPIIGWAVLIVFNALDSEPGTNKYGPNPKEGASSTPAASSSSDTSAAAPVVAAPVADTTPVVAPTPIEAPAVDASPSSDSSSATSTSADGGSSSSN